jgi:hypothetical protein
MPINRSLRSPLPLFPDLGTSEVSCVLSIEIFEGGQNGCSASVLECVASGDIFDRHAAIGAYFYRLSLIPRGASFDKPVVYRTALTRFTKQTSTICCSLITQVLENISRLSRRNYEGISRLETIATFSR